MAENNVDNADVSAAAPSGVIGKPMHRRPFLQTSAAAVATTAMVPASAAEAAINQVVAGAATAAQSAAGKAVLSFISPSISTAFAALSVPHLGRGGVGSLWEAGYSHSGFRSLLEKGRLSAVDEVVDFWRKHTKIFTMYALDLERLMETAGAKEMISAWSAFKGDINKRERDAALKYIEQVDPNKAKEIREMVANGDYYSAFFAVQDYRPSSWYRKDKQAWLEGHDSKVLQKMVSDYDADSHAINDEYMRVAGEMYDKYGISSPQVDRMLNDAGRGMVGWDYDKPLDISNPAHLKLLTSPKELVANRRRGFIKDLCEKRPQFDADELNTVLEQCEPEAIEEATRLHKRTRDSTCTAEKRLQLFTEAGLIDPQYLRHYSEIYASLPVAMKGDWCARLEPARQRNTDLSAGNSQTL